MRRTAAIFNIDFIVLTFGWWADF